MFLFLSVPVACLLPSMIFQPQFIQKATRLPTGFLVPPPPACSHGVLMTTSHLPENLVEGKGFPNLEPPSVSDTYIFLLLTL